MRSKTVVYITLVFTLFAFGYFLGEVIWGTDKYAWGMLALNAITITLSINFLIKRK